MAQDSAASVIDISGRKYISSRKLQEKGIQVSWYPSVGILTIGRETGPIRLFLGKNRYFEGFKEKNFESPLLEKGGDALVSVDLLTAYPEIWSRLGSPVSSQSTPVPAAAETAGNTTSAPSAKPVTSPKTEGPVKTSEQTTAAERAVAGQIAAEEAETTGVDPFAEAVEPSAQPLPAPGVMLRGITCEAQANEAVAIRIAFTGERPLYDLQQVEEPRSVIITLYGCGMDSPDGVLSLAGKGIISGLVVDSGDGDSLNLVANCQEPALYSVSEEPSALAVVLRPVVSGIALAQGSDLESAKTVQENTNAQMKPETTTAVPSSSAIKTTVSPVQPLPAAEDILQSIESGSLSLVSVYIDPGHGGKDSGLESEQGIREAEVNLQVALLLSRFLRAAGANVILSRESDRSVSGKERNDLLREKGTSIALSIHCGWSGNPAIRGAAVIYPNLADRSLANVLREELERSLRTEERHSIRAPIHLFKGTQSRCCLVEIGFFSNADDRAALSQPGGLVNVARALYQGIRNFTGRKR